jgi:multiple sugar transport system permease protein
VLGGFLLGFVLALLLNTNIRFRRIFRGILLAPWVIPYVVIGFLFLYMFNTKIGIVNYSLQRVGLISKFLPWLADTQLSMIAVVIANIWNQFPFHLTTMLAGLQTVPEDCIEAAKIDGAGSVDVFWHITLPWLRNIIVISTTLMMIQNFNNFALIWSITGGGPVNATTTLVIYVFRKAFEEFNFGYASAIGMVWMVLLVVFAYVYMKFAVKEID